jgi:hypothetical protein
MTKVMPVMVLSPPTAPIKQPPTGGYEKVPGIYHGYAERRGTCLLYKVAYIEQEEQDRRGQRNIIDTSKTYLLSRTLLLLFLL